MRIGMDYRPAMRATTGIGRYVRSLAGALAADCDLRLYGCFRSGNRPAVRVAPPGATLRAWPLPSRAMHLLARVGVLSTERILGGCDLFHHTNFTMAQLRKSTPQVMTLHDLAFLRDPGCHAPRAARALARVVASARRTCAAFLVPSEATARDCEEFLDIGRERIFVTPLGVDPVFFGLGVRPVTRPYLLAIGTIEPRKNYPRLLRAFRGIDLELRIAGERGWLYDEALAAAATMKNVRFEGHVSEARLCELLAGARAVAYPSLLEGFGLPVLEAMAAGKPVLTSDIEPLRSICGDAALRVDPRDEQALHDGLERLLFDEELRARLARAGPERARRFPWSLCASCTLSAYHAVLA